MTSFVCQECGYDTPEWLGKCPECGVWNSLKEIKVPIRQAQGKQSSRLEKADLKPRTLDEIKYTEKDRMSTGFSEFDTVLGGGIVPGSVILLAGDPGIGKSTLLLQVAFSIARDRSPRDNVLYISSEESEEQIKLRSKRIVKDSKTANFFVLSITNSDAIAQVIADTKPKLVIIDSIQTVESENLTGLSGSVGQVRYATSLFIKLAKSLQIPVIIVGHVTKEGMVAGPMILSHMVDCVLFLEGEKYTHTRILRSLKNRYGPVDEIGLFDMKEEGMSEVKQTEHIFITETQKKTPGTCLSVTLEGTRSFLVEIQALVLFSKLPFPRRVTAGIDTKRLELLLAVLQKSCRLAFDTTDVFVNVTGGLKLSDPACDLGICLSLFSSLKNIYLNRAVAIAEVGLLGELRDVPFLDKRIKEAKKLGFKNIITAKTYGTLNEAISSLNKSV
ncbi:MAG: DNA repair protein RadA [bacterium]|nr:DNA repair protein RadA [bacterium]